MKKVAQLFDVEVASSLVRAAQRSLGSLGQLKLKPWLLESRFLER